MVCPTDIERRPPTSYATSCNRLSTMQLQLGYSDHCNNRHTGTEILCLNVSIYRCIRPKKKCLIGVTRPTLFLPPTLNILILLCAKKNFKNTVKQIFSFSIAI